MSRAAVRSPRRVVVIGASAGGVPALSQLVAHFEADLDASVLIVLHLPPNAHSVLPEILSRAGPLPAAHPRDREPLVAGQVYVAPPDRHLLLNDDTLRVTVGPWENGHRPSVDVLFRSAARWHGSDVIAVVLSGALDDGAAGVAAVAQHGGTVFVQSPDEAEVPDMPKRAIETVPDAIVAPLDDIAIQINKLTRESPPAGPRQQSRTLQDEVDIAEGRRATPEDLGESPAGLVCPDCGGSLFEALDDHVLRFRCRVGHAWTADALAGANGRELEAALWTALRVLEEDDVLRARLASRARARGRHRSAKHYDQIAAQREPLVEAIREAIARVANEPPANAPEWRAES